MGKLRTSVAAIRVTREKARHSGGKKMGYLAEELKGRERNAINSKNKLKGKNSKQKEKTKKRKVRYHPKKKSPTSFNKGGIGFVNT